mgnify:CR=1 FL=1
MHDYVYGAGLALAEIAGHFTGAAEKTGRCSEAPTGSAERSTEKRSRKLNLLGATPLDFGPQSAVDAMKKRLKNYGWEILSTWAMGDTLEALSRAGEAAVNLVVSSVGIPAANVLKEKFGTPFLVGTPVEGYEEEISDALERIADRSCGEWVNKKDRLRGGKRRADLRETGGTVESNSGAGNLVFREGTVCQQYLTLQEKAGKCPTKMRYFFPYRTLPSSENRLPWAPWQQS